MADPLPLLTTLRMIVRELEALETPYALVGGLALMVWLPPRATTDVDLVVAVTPEQAPRFAKHLAKRLGGIPSARPIRFRSGTTLQRVVLQRPEGEILLDLMLAGDGYLAQVLSRRVRVPHVAGELHVATAEDLLVMKLQAWRPKDRPRARFAS